VLKLYRLMALAPYLRNYTVTKPPKK